MGMRKMYFIFDHETPKVGDQIVKVFHGTNDSPLGEIRTIVEDNKPFHPHMMCDDGSTYNKIAEHGWRRLVRIGYDD